MLVGIAGFFGPGRRTPSLRAAGAVRMTRQGALRTTYFVASPTKLSSGPPRPPSSAPPRIRDGSSAASTIASTPRRRASVDDRRARAARAHRRRRDLDALVLLPHRLRPRAAPRARARAERRAAARRSAAPSAPRRPRAPRSSRRCSPRVVGVLGAARRPAVWTMSSSSGVPSSGTRIEPYSTLAALGAAAPPRARRHALERATCPAAAVDDVERERRTPSSRSRRSARRSGVTSTLTSRGRGHRAPSTAGSGSVAAADAAPRAGRGRAGRGRARGSAARDREVRDREREQRAERVDADEEVEVLGTTSAAASTAAMTIRTNGVRALGCRRPIALGIWRFVASE